uniref:NudC domain containing 3 n=1 Tax=Oryzias latipes TaxID=8090 RepID=A0A3P9L6E6_ORYLA
MEPSMTEMYDNALLGILQHVGNIQDFLRVYFGFLYRKTDFYRLLSGPDDRMGFPPGVAEKMVLKVKLFEQMADQDRQRALSQLQNVEESRGVPPAAQELQVSSEPPKAEERSGVEAPQPESAASEAPDAAAAAGEAAAPTSGAEEEELPGRARLLTGLFFRNQEMFQANPDSYNGAQRENYSWSQDYTDVEVRVFVPKTVVRGRQVSPSRCAAMRSTQKTPCGAWSPGSLSLSKTSETWWNAVLKGEEEIDINRINRERSMATVDEEEHAVLDRLTFDYHQKLQGKPQSHEMKVHDMLKKGWDAEGSPFRGQQFDPSMFDIPPSAVQF